MKLDVFFTLVGNFQHPVMGKWADIATDVTNVSCIPSFAGLLLWTFMFICASVLCIYYGIHIIAKISHDMIYPSSIDIFC